jgi:hypothetical protein
MSLHHFGELLAIFGKVCRPLDEIQITISRIGDSFFFISSLTFYLYHLIKLMRLTQETDDCCVQYWNIIYIS